MLIRLLRAVVVFGGGMATAVAATASTTAIPIGEWRDSKTSRGSRTTTALAVAALTAAVPNGE